ncbi:MAG: hypothetical protein KF884_10700 [Fimbriimonadaceae bacterium]|nr:hypothetical protein [Fimbriimonadaceae bacterium]QYK58015.1 MAG: hypothetical protein KF884_10700 [Fimbriimonadaceae bacterium]
MPGTFGGQSLASFGTVFAALAVPDSGRQKVGGVTIDWSTVPPIGRNEVVSVQITGSPTGGTFALVFGGQTTSNLAYNADAAAIEAALELLSTIGNGNVRVSGTNPFALEFIEDLGKTNVGAVTAVNNLTGGTSPNVVISVTTEGRSESDLTLSDGTVVKAGDKFIEAGTVLVEISVSGRYGPFSASASDGRQTVASKRGKVFILNQTLLMSEAGSEVTGHVFDAGVFFKQRVKLASAGGPSESDLLSALPGVTWSS